MRFIESDIAEIATKGAAKPQLHFVERRDEKAGWAHLVVVGNHSWAVMEFDRADWCGWKHRKTRLSANAADWPDMTAEEIVAWMRHNWTCVSETFIADDPAAVAAKFAPSVVDGTCIHAAKGERCESDICSQCIEDGE